MTKVAAGITTSLDGYITGPNDGPGRGLGEGGERLHHRVFGIVTHRPQDAPAGAGFTFVDGLAQAIARAREAADGKDVFAMGGADVIRQAPRGGHVEELSISTAPVVLGGGKRLFDGFEETLALEHLRLLQSRFATHVTYRVVR